MSKKFPQVIFDIAIGGTSVGRITFELFTDITPKTAENFRGLCTGEYGTTTINGNKKKLIYKDSKFHRIIDQFVVQGGDFVNGNGTGNASIYGGQFADENFSRRHACAGLLSMANAGRNTNGSQFFITLKACPHLDGKHVVFGQVIDGMDVVRKMAKVPVDMNDKPKIPVEIINCDQIGDARHYIRNDPFSKDNQLIIKKSELEKQEQIASDLHKEEQEQHRQKLEKLKNQIKQLDQAKQEEDEELQILNQASKKLSQSTQERLKAIQLKMNEARRGNTKAVLEEQIRAEDPNYEKNKKLQKYYEKKEQKLKTLESQGLTKEQTYLNQTASQAEYSKGKQKNKNESFGWDVFNSDSVYKAYEKRCSNLKVDQEHYQKQKENPNIGSLEEGASRLSEDLQKQIEKRAKFSNRRKYNEDEKVDFINDRNKVFNQKLNRAFDPYVQEIRENLERKTAQNF
ncbi:Cyclophilin-like peptidyl-prolyl cis-trans isomerase domain [Pseudocohnilembus persalinus]|uniref:peptidylprolyl isomerase n=2 Tax=Eukaryota TaxID=2759 RepID=A0A0V0QIA0_PSEPJ|nr:Cyclophilin-like peptidyl-prolyl cis-trans isomerase domain [Pseudocohnilembus persalinus]|eukprot:KRX01818.1 Cyclophilin-like peptidyl-prolyl cis-trans isomerase domain [Pseudocohnilembus persalinus]